jgi:hypothetical protein
MLLKTNMNEISVGAVKEILGNAIKFVGGIVSRHKLTSALIFVFLIKITFLTFFYHTVLIHQKVKIEASGMAHDLISYNQKF